MYTILDTYLIYVYGEFLVENFIYTMRRLYVNTFVYITCFYTYFQRSKMYFYHVRTYTTHIIHTYIQDTYIYSKNKTMRISDCANVGSEDE